jgi:hypothetical protein
MSRAAGGLQGAPKYNLNILDLGQCQSSAYFPEGYHGVEHRYTALLLSIGRPLAGSPLERPVGR